MILATFGDILAGKSNKTIAITARDNSQVEMDLTQSNDGELRLSIIQNLAKGSIPYNFREAVFKNIFSKRTTISALINRLRAILKNGKDIVQNQPNQVRYWDLN